MKTLTQAAQKAIEQPLQVRPALAPVTEGLGVAVWALLWIAFLQRFLNGPSLGPILVLGITLLGFAVADFMSGFIHWFFDTFLHETTPVLGPQFVAPFREHHRDQMAMTRHGFLELNGNNCLGFLPLNLSVWWFGPMVPETLGGVVGYLFLVSFSFALTATNQLHSWAHSPEPPRIARWLQRCGLAVSPAHHARHHEPPHHISYCVTNGWINHVADRSGFFAYAERVVAALGVPRQKN